MRWSVLQVFRKDRSAASAASATATEAVAAGTTAARTTAAATSAATTTATAASAATEATTARILAVTAATSAASTTGASAGAACLGLVHLQRAAVELLPVERRDRGRGILIPSPSPRRQAAGVPSRGP